MFWRRKSGGGGRPRIAREIRELIIRLSKENRTWRAPRIKKELALLGYRVSVNSVRRYMHQGGRPSTGQSWATFLKNHAHEIAACDLFTVPTISFKVLKVFVVMSLDRRRILVVGVTSRRALTWVARQIKRALGQCNGVRLLLHDNDAIFTRAFLEALRELDVRSLVTNPGAPWMKGTSNA